MSGCLPSQRAGNPRGYCRRSRAVGELSGRRIDEALNVTWLLMRWRLIQQVGTAIQIKAVRAYIECGGNAKEAAFRAGVADHSSITSGVRGAIKRVIRAEAVAS